MAASKSRPRRCPATRPAAPATRRREDPRRHGRRRVATSVEVWSDEDEARATGLLPILAPDGTRRRARASPRSTPALLRELHRGMLRSRVLDETMLTLQRQGRIGFYAEARGQEAAVIGAVAALEAPTTTSCRRTASSAPRSTAGCRCASVVAQLFGNAHDIARGRQMPVHPAAPRALNFIPPSSCVATQLPHAAGLAWAAKMLHEEDRRCSPTSARARPAPRTSTPA